MTVYIVQEEKELKIFQILEEQEAAFQADYWGKILVSGASIQEALIAFGQLPNPPAFPEEESPK